MLASTKFNNKLDSPDENMYTISESKKWVAVHNFSDQIGGPQNLQISKNFEKLEDALSIAERMAREAVEMRAAMAKRLAEKEKERHEKQLMELAIKARIDRAGKNDVKRERDRVERQTGKNED